MAKKKAKKTEADIEIQSQDNEEQLVSEAAPEPAPAEQSKTIRIRNNLRNPQTVSLSTLQPGEEVELREQDLWQRELDRINHGIATGVLEKVN